MTTSIGKITSFLLLAATLLFGGSEPYRIRMTSSASKARLVGVAGTPTEADTVAGTYTYTLMMHDFPVEHTGNYVLQEDPLGGTSYATRTDWSDATGKFILGRDAQYGIWGERNRKYYSGIQAMIDGDGSDTTGGFLIGRPNYTEYIDHVDGVHEIRLNSRTDLMLPKSYKIDWKCTNYDYRGSVTATRENGAVLFAIGGDTNVVVSGGELYGNADTNYYTGNVVSTPVGNREITIDGLNVAADSLRKWYIYITSGTGATQSRRIDYNDATVGGNTKCYLTKGWVTKPTSGSDYRITPMEEWQNAFEISKARRITIKDMYIHDFPGDGMSISGAEDILIENCDIYNPYHWFVGTSGDSAEHNLVGRQGITLGGGNETRFNLIRPDTTLAYRTGYDTLRNIKITKCKIRGGYPGGIDLEPIGRVYVDNLEISECDISNTPGFGGSGIIIYMADSSIVKNLIIRDNIIRSDGVGIWLAINGSVIADSSTFTEAIDATEYSIDVADGTVFAADDWVTLGNDAEFCRVYQVGGNTLTLYNSGGVRTTYNDGPTGSTHSIGGKIYKTWGSGSDYGYWENVQITGNTITPITPGENTTGIYLLGGSPYRRMTISNNYIAGHGSHGIEDTCPFEDIVLSGNTFYNNATWNTFYFPHGRRLRVENNLFKDNAYSYADSVGTQLYIAGVNNLTLRNNVFECTNDSTIDRGAAIIMCDSVLTANNFIYGHRNNYINTWGNSNYKDEGNIVGFSSFSTSDSLGADTNYDYGNSDPGDTTVAKYNETKRTSLRFLGFRDVGAGYLGSKIVSQSTANPGYSGHEWLVQNGHLLFYTLNTFPITTDDTRLRAIITGNGLGLADSAYINFFPKNSASNTDPDTLWKYIGESGYGIRDSSGYIQYKNSGGDWARIGSVSGGGGSGDVSGPASSTDQAIAIFNGVDGKTIQNSTATLSDGGELTVPVIYSTPTQPIGVLVTKEHTIAGTDSSVELGVATGRGYIKFHSGDGDNSTITTDNNDYMFLKDAAQYVVAKKGGTFGLFVSGEDPATFTGTDSAAVLQMNSSGNGELYLVSAAGFMSGDAHIAVDGTNNLNFTGATKYTFDNPISVLTDMIFVGVKTGTYAATQGQVWICGDTLFHKYDASNSNYWLKDGTSTKH